MKAAFSLVVGVSSFLVLGNAQDGGAATAYGTQGNAAYNRSLHEAELERAAVEARRMKELMAAMASQAPSRQPVYTTAEQFLEANRPPALPPEERPEPVRGSSYVPPFDYSAPVNRDTTAPASPPVSMESTPKKERGLFGWLKPRDSDGPEFTSPVGAADYRTAEGYEGPDNSAMAPSTENSAGFEAAIEAPEVEESIADATVGAESSASQVGSGEKAGFFGRLFGRKQADETPAPAVSDRVEPASYPEVADVPAESFGDGDVGGVPETPDWTGEEAPAAMPDPDPVVAPTEPTESGASIFVRRPEPAQQGQVASVRREDNATVNGVYVKLYEGTRVTVLRSSGSEATIQLPDGRVGTIPRGALQM